MISEISDIRLRNNNIMTMNTLQETTFPLITSLKISDSAYEILHEKIVSRELFPGQRLDLKLMQAEMGISTTPLKEALATLEMEGLVEIRPRSGTFVTDPSPDDISKSFDVRIALEVFAVGLVAKQVGAEDLQKLRSVIQELAGLASAPDQTSIYPKYLHLDHQFHELLVSMTKNERLIMIHRRENLHAQMARIRYRRSERELQVAQGEHELLIQALVAHDMRAAQEIMESHLQRAKLSVLADIDFITRNDHS
jgi:GntR family transcriptional regulator, rspAB operon transcriptional repressor